MKLSGRRQALGGALLKLPKDKGYTNARWAFRDNLGMKNWGKL